MKKQFFVFLLPFISGINEKWNKSSPLSLVCLFFFSFSSQNKFWKKVLLKKEI